MKYCFSTLGCPNYTVDQIIAYAKELGFEGVEIRAVEGKTEIWELDVFKPENLEKTAKKFIEAGIEVVGIGTSIRFNKCDEQNEQKQLQIAETVMNIAKNLGSKYIRIFGGPLLPSQEYCESIRWIIQGFNKIAVLGESLEIMPLLETHDDFSTAVRCIELLKGVASNNIGVIWDILHPYRFGEDMRKTYRLLKEYIKHVHIKDSSEFSDKGFDIKLVGEGKVPVSQAISLLKDGGYDGYLSFEWEKMWHPEIPDATEAFPHFIHIIKNM